MLTEFVSLQMSREELRQMHDALVQAAIVEDRLRQERGLELTHDHAMLERFEMLLGENEEALHERDHMLEDDLWEYAWFSFTDEWAWHRARQEVEQELGEVRVKEMDAASFEKVLEQRYRKDFERYVKEVDMLEHKKPAKRASKQTKIS